MRQTEEREKWPTSFTHLLDDQPPKTMTDEDNGPQLCIFILLGVEQGHQEILGVLVNPSLARRALEGAVVIEGQDPNVLDMIRQKLRWPERPVSSLPCFPRMSAKTSNEHDAIVATLVNIRSCLFSWRGKHVLCLQFWAFLPFRVFKGRVELYQVHAKFVVFVQVVHVSIVHFILVEKSLLDWLH